MKYEIAIIGPREQILGFSAVGVRAIFADDFDAAREKLFATKKAIEKGDEKIGIVFVLEEYLAALSAEEYQKLSAGALPAIIPLPGISGGTGFGNEKIRRIVEKAVGSDIFGNDK
jgi:V/A-type H+-transporting ATPase subunit F